MITLIAYSKQGCKTARKVSALYQNEDISAYTMARFNYDDFSAIIPKSDAFYERLFNTSDILIFIGSCGIAVRKIAPFIKSKDSDPAVIVIDELGRFVIPLLSGHIGGANEAATKIAHGLNATPVVTTATDINKKFAVDSWATKNGYVIADIKKIKTISAEILERNVMINSQFAIKTPLANGLQIANSGNIGIYIGVKTTEPFKQTLRLIPKVLHLGIGCKKDTSELTIKTAVEEVFNTHHFDFRAVKAVHSIDIKANEGGLLDFCSSRNLPISFYSAKELNQLEGEFTSSDFVKSITGVDTVCERAAMMQSDELIVHKFALNGVTVAVGIEHMEVSFE